MGNKTALTKNWGFLWATIIFGLWLAFWIVFMGFLQKVRLVGIPLITWSQIFVGVFGLCVSILAIFKLERIESE